MIKHLKEPNYLQCNLESLLEYVKHQYINISESTNIPETWLSQNQPDCIKPLQKNQIIRQC